MAENYVEMELREICLRNDPPPAIELGEVDGSRTFQIFIGYNEALAMDFTVTGKRPPPRPMTHDLILNVVEGLGASLLRVLVVKLEENTFFGALELQTSDGSVKRIDSRPSDAIVLAMKRHVPIYVEENVLREVQRNEDQFTDPEDEEPET